MNIFANKTIQNIANNSTVQKIASQMCNYKDAILPVAMLETTVIAGRSYQAYKRGGKTECRERLIDETVTAIVWLQIISWLNKGLEAVIKRPHIFSQKGLPEISTDFGSDAIRNPLKRAINARPEIEKVIGGVKLSKIAMSALVGIYFSGVMLPKFYQNLTRKILKKEKEEKENKLPTNHISMDEFLKQTSKNKNVSFGNSTVNIHAIAHILETNPIAKLLTIDAGLFAGRAYNARNNDERTEILFRDPVSSFFYMGCTPIMYSLLSKYLDKFKGKNTDLDPNTANYVTEYLQGKLKDQKLNPQEFLKAACGENESLVKQVLAAFDREVISLNDAKLVLQKLNVNPEQTTAIMDRLQTFINLRPQCASKDLLTRSEITNAIKGGYINDPAFLTKAVEVSTRGASQDATRFVSFKRIDSIKENIKRYTESIATYAEKAGQNISSDIIKQTKTRNLFVKVGYTLAGMAVSSLFLSTLIPKLQYKITEWRTGNKEFPGIKDIK
ncbi:MAG: hypothetical protein K6A44_07420 [bacterium]|nr:hypothetical protein [bacterium]